MATWKLPPLPPLPPQRAITGDVIEVTGIDTLSANMSVIPQLATAATLDALLKVGQECMDDSKENYCPFRFGVLRESGICEPNEEHDGIKLSYGGPGSQAEAYALEQHENLSYHHPIGGAKYLELPVIKWTPEFVEASGQSTRVMLEKISTGWASGDWKQVTAIRERPVGAVVGGYTRKSGRTVSSYYRRRRVQ